jgi:glycosyltransferase involved in cell wall biosynthesis
LREKIIELMSSAGTRQDISHSQRQRILKHYPWQNIAARYAAVYRSALGWSGGAHAHVRAERRMQH